MKQVLKRKKFLIITTSGGGAHLTTSEALKDRLEAETLSASKPDLIITKDVLKEWIGPIGHFGIYAWNSSMRKGKTHRLQKLLAMQRASDIVFFPIFFYTLYYLWKYKIDAIYDCQPLGTRYIMMASRIVSILQNRHILVMKVLTEPTNDLLKQYMAPIKSMSNLLRKHIKIWGGPPLCRPGQSENEFWEMTCGIEPHQIFFETGYPIRTPFIDLAKLKPRQKPDLIINTGSYEEAEWIQNKFNFSFASLKEESEGKLTWELNIPENSKIITIMLGSQGTADATVEYTRLILKNRSNPLIYIFVYVGSFVSGGKHLLNKINHMVKRYSSETKVIPMSFQSGEVLARLMYRTDVSITRSGGATCMELLTIGKGHPLIHSAKDKSFSQNQGLLEHEYGNYLCLKEFHPNGAQLVDSKNLVPTLNRILPDQKNSLELFST